MSPARLIVMAIAMMAAPAATPVRAQGHHGAAPAHGTEAAKPAAPEHGDKAVKPVAPEHGDKTVKAAAPVPAAAAKAKAAPPPRTTATSARDALARIARRLEEELPPAKPKGKAAGGVAGEPGSAHADPVRTGAARGRRPAERPRVNLDWRLSVAWTASADALIGRESVEEDKAAPLVLEACANPLHVHLDAGVSSSRLMPPVHSSNCPSR